MNHTPTPWYSELEIDSSFWILAKGHIVAKVEPRENARANAEFIVAACNAHEDLVKALKLAKEMLLEAYQKGQENGDDLGTELWQKNIEKVSKAIAKAGVK